MKEKAILGFDGSPHAGGQCEKLLKESLEILGKGGAKTEYIKLTDLQLPIFHGKYVEDGPVDHNELWEKIKKADGFIFATPVHWFNMSASMKNFIDWLTTLEFNNFHLEGKVGAVITTCEEDGGQKTINDIVAPLMHHGVIFYPYSSLFFNLNMNKNSENDWMNKDLNILSNNMLKMLSLIEATKKGFWDY